MPRESCHKTKIVSQDSTYALKDNVIKSGKKLVSNYSVMEVSYQHSYLHLIFKVISNQVCSFPSLTLSTIPLGLFFLFFLKKSNVIKYHKFMLSSFFSENLVLCDHGASYDDISGIRPKSRNIRGAVCWYFLLLRTPLNEIRTLLSNVNLSRVLM